MSSTLIVETHAPFWIYGSGAIQLEFAPSSLTPRVTIDGRAGRAPLSKGWHLVTVDVDMLVNVAGEKRKVGLRLLRVTRSPSRDGSSENTQRGPRTTGRGPILIVSEMRLFLRLLSPNPSRGRTN